MKPIPVDIACNLCDLVCDFLISCGGNYKQVTPTLQEKLLVCIASRQFIIKIREGKIKYFLCWFNVHEQDVESLKERVLPLDVFTGDIVYIAEFANTEGKAGMYEMIKKLRKRNPKAKEVFWHRPIKRDKVFHFKVRGNYGR